MKIHKLKLDSLFFEDTQRGKKDFEIRFNDRGFQTGDILELYSWNSEFETYTKPMPEPLIRRVKYVLSGWGLKDGYVVLGLGSLANPPQDEL